MISELVLAQDTAAKVRETLDHLRIG